MSDDASGAHPREEPVGSLGEEAGKLLGALSSWARDHGSDLGAAARVVEEHRATGATECTYCPICRGVHVIRETSPEVRDQLMVAATALLRVGTEVLSAWREQAPPSPGVEHIDLDDDHEDQDHDEQESPR